MKWKFWRFELCCISWNVFCWCEWCYMVIFGFKHNRSDSLSFGEKSSSLVIDKKNSFHFMGGFCFSLEIRLPCPEVRSRVCLPNGSASEVMRKWAQAAPVPWPMMVTLSGSPPKRAMFSWTQWRAAIWFEQVWSLPQFSFPSVSDLLSSYLFRG